MGFRTWILVAVVASTGAFLGAVFTTVAPALSLIVQHYGGGQHGTFIAESLLTLPSIGIMIGGPVTGWLVERLGSRAVLLACLVVFGLAGLAGLVIEDSSLLLLSRLIAGIAAVGQSTAATAVVGEVFVGQRRGSILGLQVALATVLGAGVTLAAGRLATEGGWRAPFSLYALAFVVALLATLAVATQRRPVRDVSKAESSLMPLLPIFLGVAAAMVAGFISLNQVPLILAELGRADPTLIAAVSVGTTLATTVGALIYARLIAMLGAQRAMALGGALQGAGVFSLAVGQSVSMVIFGSIVLGFGSGTLYPAFSHRILDRAPDSAKGRAVGLMFTAQFAGTFVSTALVVPAVVRFGRHDSLLLGAAVLLVGWIVPSLRRGARRPAVETATAKME